MFRSTDNTLLKYKSTSIPKQGTNLTAFHLHIGSWKFAWCYLGINCPAILAG